MFQTTSGAETSVPGETDAIAAFLEQDSSCREVLNGRSLADFLTEFTGATRDHEQSRHAIQYVVYRQSMFMYEFLDEKLFAIRFVVPRSRKSADDWIAPYQKAFGPPTTTQTPDDFQDVKVSRFQSWDLPRHNLRVNFADLPASFGEADLDLFGQFINLERAKRVATKWLRLAVDRRTFLALPRAQHSPFALPRTTASLTTGNRRGAP